jgi:hypothetical protein
MERVGWGTRLDLTCSYDDQYDVVDGRVYALVVHTKDGSVTQVGNWRALPGKTMTLTAATAAAEEDITAVDLTTSTGLTVLRWTG